MQLAKRGELCLGDDGTRAVWSTACVCGIGTSAEEETAALAKTFTIRAQV